MTALLWLHLLADVLIALCLYVEVRHRGVDGALRAAARLLMAAARAWQAMRAAYTRWLAEYGKRDAEDWEAERA